MGWTSLIALLLIPIASEAATYPCGTSFTPCPSKAFGVRTVPDTFGGKDLLFHKAKESDRIKQKEAQRLVSFSQISSAAREGVREMSYMFNNTEKSMMKSIRGSELNPSEVAWLSFMKADQYAKYLSYSALVSLAATKKLFKSVSSMDTLSFSNVSGTDIEKNCPINQIDECVAGKYRSYSGHCNNILSPLRGAVYEPMRRMLSPDYADKISDPRVATNGKVLPSPLVLSTLFTPAPAGHVSCSLMLAQWSSFLYDDLAHISRAFYNLNQESTQEHIPMPCCRNNVTHSECYPILKNGSDECLSYTRTIPVPRENCTLGFREQGNLVTSYLDGSQIYGSFTETTNRLRSFQDGKLAMRVWPSYRNGIPMDASSSDVFCRTSNPSYKCFLTGNHRSNFLPSSNSFYALWMRQHNRVAEKLKKLNTEWDDERLFQETRRIIVAQIQHITYREYLPLIIGKNNIVKYQLSLRSHGYDSSYDIKKDGSVFNEFATAVGQIFLTLLPDELLTMNLDGTVTKRLRLEKVFNDPSILYENGRIDSILRGLLRSPILKPGLHMSDQLKNTFGQNVKQGIDLAAMLIQMGRDHGIPGYLKFRRLCQLESAESFGALSTQFKDSVNITEIQNIYEDPNDIDLIVGGLAEKPVSGALLGPTFACLYAIQMRDTKQGDRFWYENFLAPSAFTVNQVDELRKTTLARIICDNTDNIGLVQPNPFSLPDIYGNCPMTCESAVLQGPNFQLWKEAELPRKLPTTRATLEKAIRLGIEQYARLQEAEGKRLAEIPLTVGPSSLFSHAALLAPKQKSLDIAKTAGVLREVTNILITGEGLSDDEKLPAELDVLTLQKLLPSIEVSSIIGNFTPYLGRDPLPKEQCLPQPLPCDHTTKYRSYSGWCNNLNNPKYGNAFEAMRRIIEPSYDDGFDSPRMKSVLGGDLPSARSISNAVHNDKPIFHTRFSHLLMQFGQILDHDMAHSPIARGANNTILNCSRCDSFDTLSIHCFPIKIDEGDPFFPHKHADGSPRCIPFARSLLAQLTLGYRNQLNQLTSFIDGSFLYGSTECEANKLRYFRSGKMNFTNLGFNKEALPQGNQERDCRSTLLQGNKKCFQAGDERNNEHPGLTVIHNIFLREHNRIATKLERLNNLWNDEILFQETRRILIAKIQHIVYNEWLPIVLGCSTMEKYDLRPLANGYYAGYDESCDATMSQEMSTSAFRFGHTLIRAEFPRMNDQFRNVTSSVILKDHFSNPSPLYDQREGHLESILMGLLGAESMAFDRHVIDALRNHLFAKPGATYSGIDLPAVNIQRARDHGVAGYNRYREVCKLHRVHRFEDLKDVMDSQAIQSLKSVYKHVDDIDLFPGIMSERPMIGALVGPTLACLIAEQMSRLKKCDRFYYENDNRMTRFTPDQLAEIRKTTMSKLICENSVYAKNVQPNSFLLPDDLQNAPMPCASLSDTDLSPWADRKFCIIDERVINLGRTKRITPCVSCTCTIEGAECHSMTIENCNDLVQSYTKSDLLKDPVCLVQCAAFITRA
ncbi:unnamed protein product [Auanema sp. JU1783]|nr:unnamed protein product [Auanema sp. JU1783]